MNTETLDRPFIIRPYTKAELASMYIPNCTRRVALRKFNDWLRLNPALWEKLQKASLSVKTREYNYTQVGIIVGHLGEP